jgi:RNA polymerase sigma factor (TIGR02999 family)
MTKPDSRITRLLEEWSDGDLDALDRLAPLVVDELRRLARAHLSRERSNHTLQPTALVNELFARLLGRRRVHWENRRQFFKGASDLMRHILVDHARRHKAERRGGGARKIPLEIAPLPIVSPDIDLLALDEALKELERDDPERREIVELKFFFGLTHEQIGEILDIAPSTVKLKWSTARARLARRLQGE